MLCNVVVVSVVPQHKSVIIIYIPSCLTLSPQPFDSSWWLSQSTKLGSLCYIAASSKLSISHMIVFTRQWYFLNLSYSFLPLTVSTRPVSMSASSFLSVNRCPGNIYCINENNLLIVSKWPFKVEHKTFKYAASKIIFVFNNVKEETKYKG